MLHYTSVSALIPHLLVINSSTLNIFVNCKHLLISTKCTHLQPLHYIQITNNSNIMPKNNYFFFALVSDLFTFIVKHFTKSIVCFHLVANDRQLLGNLLRHWYIQFGMFCHQGQRMHTIPTVESIKSFLEFYFERNIVLIVLVLSESIAHFSTKETPRS